MHKNLHAKLGDQSVFNNEVFGNHTTALQMMQATYAEVIVENTLIFQFCVKVFILYRFLDHHLVITQQHCK